MTYIPDLWTARNDGTGTGLDADLLDGVEGSAFLQDITGEALETLSDVTITTIASGELLQWNGSIWINQTLAEIGVLIDITGEALSTLSDVTITGIASGELLKWDGAAWINNTLAEAGISATGHSHVATDVTDFSSAADARIALATIADLALTTISAIASGELLMWNGSLWLNQTLAEAGIQAAGSYLTDITGEALETLSDVTITTIADGELLRWNGSIWINNTLAEAGIQAAGQVADLTITAKTGAYTIVDSDDVVTGDSSGGTFTLTLPTSVGADGKVYHIKKIDSSANVVTIDGDGSETIDGSTTVTLDVEWHSLTLVSDGANWLII